MESVSGLSRLNHDFPFKGLHFLLDLAKQFIVDRTANNTYVGILLCYLFGRLKTWRRRGGSKRFYEGLYFVSLFYSLISGFLPYCFSWTRRYSLSVQS